MLLFYIIFKDTNEKLASFWFKFLCIMFKIISLHLSCYRWGLGREGRFLPEGFWILTLLWRNHVGTVHGRILHTEKGVKTLQEKIVFSLLASWESKRAPEFLIRLSLHPSFMPQHTHWKECPPPVQMKTMYPTLSSIEQSVRLSLFLWFDASEST